jgi:hypothetical protein
LDDKHYRYAGLVWLCCMVQLYGLCTPIIYLALTTLVLVALYFRRYKKKSVNQSYNYTINKL